MPLPVSLRSLANSAELRTRGFEFELGVDIIKTPDILWSFGVNGAHYKTILTKVPEGTGSDKLNGMWEANPDGWTAAGTGTISNGAFYLRGVGKPYYNVYQYLYGGVDQTTGLPADLFDGNFGEYRGTARIALCGGTERGQYGIHHEPLAGHPAGDR